MLEKSIQNLYQDSATGYNDCVMQEIKNNNQAAFTQYDTLIDSINKQLSLLRSQHNLDRISAVNKVSLGKIYELKSKAISRKVLLVERMNNKEIYTINKSKISDASSYSGFSSAFKPPVEPAKDIHFKTPQVPHTLNRASSTIHKIPKRVQSENIVTRKSLDLPQSRPSLELRPRTPRQQRPKSTELTISRAAIMAWEQPRKIASTTRKVSPPSVPQSPVLSGVHHPPQHTKQRPKKKYEYVQPTVNTQITLTHVNKTHPKTRKPSPSHQHTKSVPVLLKEGVNSPASTPTSDSTPKWKKHKDPKIDKMMEDLSGVDEQAVLQILDEIMVTESDLKWDDLAGLNQAKQSLKETVVYPFLRPDLFKGLREPISGMLLFGPPGTGKTMIAKTVANESNSTFFSISASSLLSKYLGESEKLIRALFYVAKKLTPSIIFFDEIDSLLTARSDGEQESSRRVKTEFLIQWSSLSSATAKDQDIDPPRVLVLAATNLPWAIDEAARRRFSRRLYIPLPEFDTRLSQLKKLMGNSHHSLSETDFIIVANITEGYSNSDITSLAKDAAMEPIRDLGESLMNIGNHQDIRSVNVSDFEKAMRTIKKSVGKETLLRFDEWAEKFGSGGA